MRQIKFRAWNNYYKETLSHDDLIEKIEEGVEKETIPNHFVRYDTCLLSAILESEKLQERYELMQFTGLYDKNGTEIYEGDIVFVVYSILDSKEYYGVKFDNGSFVFYNKEQYVNLKIENCKDVEVIGNIFDNKELLKTE